MQLSVDICIYRVATHMVLCQPLVWITQSFYAATANIESRKYPTSGYLKVKLFGWVLKNEFTLNFPLWTFLYNVRLRWRPFFKTGIIHLQMKRIRLNRRLTLVLHTAATMFFSVVWYLQRISGVICIICFLLSMSLVLKVRVFWTIPAGSILDRSWSNLYQFGNMSESWVYNMIIKHMKWKL